MDGPISWVAIHIGKELLSVTMAQGETLKGNPCIAKDSHAPNALPDVQTEYYVTKMRRDVARLESAFDENQKFVLVC